MKNHDKEVLQTHIHIHRGGNSSQQLSVCFPFTKIEEAIPVWRKTRKSLVDGVLRRIKGLRITHQVLSTERKDEICFRMISQQFEEEEKSKDRKYFSRKESSGNK